MRTIAFWLSLVLIFMIPWEDSVSIAALGSLTRVAGLAVAAFWVFTVLVTGRFRKLHPFHVAVYLFVLWNIASIFWSSAIEETLGRVSTYIQLFGLVLILWDLYTTPAALRAGLQAYVLGAWVSITSTVVNYLAGQEFRVYSGGRYSATGLNPGDLAIILALGVPVAWYLAVSAGNGTKNYVQRLVNYAYVPAALFAIALTASRMALLAIVPAIVYILRTGIQSRLDSRILILAVLIMAIFALQLYIPQSSIDRLATTGASIATGDLGGRMDLWRAAIEVFSAHPLLGVGSGALRTVIQLGGVAHNTFLSIPAEVGIIGAALFAVTLAMVAYLAVSQPGKHAGLWLTVLMVWAIGVSAQTWEHRKVTWLFLSLVVIGASLSGQSAQSTLQSESSEFKTVA